MRVLAVLGWHPTHAPAEAHGWDANAGARVAIARVRPIYLAGPAALHIRYVASAAMVTAVLPPSSSVMRKKP